MDNSVRRNSIEWPVIGVRKILQRQSTAPQTNQEVQNETATTTQDVQTVEEDLSQMVQRLTVTNTTLSTKTRDVKQKSRRPRSKQAYSLSLSMLMKKGPCRPYYKDKWTTQKKARMKQEIHKTGKKSLFPKIVFNRLKRQILAAREQRRNSAKAVVPETKTDIVKDDNTTNEFPKSTRRFRSYCSNKITPELIDNTNELLTMLFKFQDRAYLKNNTKARAHKRFVVGLKQTKRAMNKAKIVIIAPDLEPCPGDEGLDSAVEEIKSLAEELSVPVLFSTSRRKLGYLMHKKVPVSSIAILDYSGAEVQFNRLIQLLKDNTVRLKPNI